jgi:hypothetical protein
VRLRPRPERWSERACVIVKWQQVFYVLDSAHRLLWVGGDWDDFAALNDGAPARASRVLGTRLTDHLAGVEMQETMHALLSDVCAMKRTLRIGCRCDSPTQRRDMRMTITPLRDDRLMVTHDLLDAQTLPSIGRGWSYLPGAFDCKCSLCGALRRRNVWADPFCTGQRHPELVDYDICPGCREMIGRERARIRRAGRPT